MSIEVSKADAKIMIEQSKEMIKIGKKQIELANKAIRRANIDMVSAESILKNLGVK